MQKVIIAFLVSLLITYCSSAQDAPSKIFKRMNVDVSADTLKKLLLTGYEIILDSCTISGRFVYHNKIHRDFVIMNSTFECEISFSSAHFVGNTDFRGSTFLHFVSFEGTQFGRISNSDKHVSFNQVTFSGPAIFNFANFYVSTSFRSATFAKCVSFNYANFRESADFEWTMFEDCVNLSILNLHRVNAAIFVGTFRNSGRLFSGSFKGSKFKNTSFANAYLNNVIMEPDSISTTSMSSLAFAKGLRQLKFHTPEMLSKIKSYFRINHYRQAEREITCALKRHDQNWLETIVFDYTSEYGSNFIRPIQMLLGIWFGCSIIYFFLFRFSKKSRLMITTTSYSYTGVVFVESDTTERYLPRKLLNNIGYAFLFSLLSTFNIGFRDFNFGRIIRLLLYKNMDFRPTGALRTVSAIQAILSVFLIGLWILSYFGRPFD